MGKVLFLLFTVVPVLELALLVQLGGLVGTAPTIALVLFTGVVGAALAKREGLKVMRDWQSALALGRLPDEGVVSGLLVLVGGVLLVTPGMLTDVLGFSLLIPPARRRIAEVVKRVALERFELHAHHAVHRGTPGADFGGAGFGGPGFGGAGFGSAGFGGPGEARGGQGEVIDIEVEPARS